MAYTRPIASAADATFLGKAPYLRPTAGAADAAFPSASFEATIAAAVQITAGATADHGVGVIGAASVPVTSAAEAEFTQADIAGAIVAALPVVAGVDLVQGVAVDAAASVGVASSGTTAHGVVATAGAVVGLSASITALVDRYELVGEVRLGGVLVNRRVRAYRRDTGALVAQADTVAGRFRVHAGFDPDIEHYLVPVDLSDTATDWAPPAANRVLPVLAMDA